MIERLEEKLILLGKPVLITVTRMDCGIEVLIAGGDLSHIGAVSIADPGGHIHTVIFEGHKDQLISEAWAEALYGVYQTPAVVSVGIHYDHIDAAGIGLVMTEMKRALTRILDNRVGVNPIR